MFYGDFLMLIIKVVFDGPLVLELWQEEILTCNDNYT